MGGAAAVAVVLAAAAWYGVVSEADRRMNGTSHPPPYDVPDHARRLHGRLFVADMHSDFLLWKRNLLKRYGRGHVDLPRLVEGNVGLQVFSVVTKSPWGQNYHRNVGDSDRITLLAVAQGWPIRTWGSLRERALHQARRLYDAAEDGQISLVRGADDLDRFLERRKSEPRRVAALLALEGMHAIEGRLENVDVLFDAGFRMMAPVHMFDNDVAGSAHGAGQGGLTDLGRSAVRRMEELGVVVDLAHASDAAIHDVLAMATRPVVVSHTGVRGTCDSPRNLSDEHLRSIAATGGLIGIGFWERAVCGTAVQDIVRAVRHAADVAGVEHVALGSDFDGTVLTAFDVTGMPVLTGALLDQGFREDEIEKIMGGNVVRVLRATLPGS